ncbi:MAG TPA: M56 family metallopeptidase [Pirellulales bacterium]|nr:M56 family metallopeptidase [Pirellulales bacterium]
MNALAWLDESFSLRFVQTLLHFLWQGALVAIAACGVEHLLLRGTAQARHRYLLYVVALLAMVCCLPATFALLRMPSGMNESRAGDDVAAPHDDLVAMAALEDLAKSQARERTEPGDGSSSNIASAAGRSHNAREEHAPARFGRNNEKRAPAHNSSTSTVPTAERQNAGDWLPVVAPYITGAYLVCVLALLARLAAGVWGGHRLRATSVAVADTNLLAAIARQTKRMGLRAAPAVAYCRRVSVPVVVGIVRPIILLPAWLASGLTPQQVEALLAHELAHLRRWDPLVNLLQRLAETIVFFHPAVWYVSRHIGIERENASDDLVLAAGWQRLHYADALVRMAELATTVRKRPSQQALGLAASGGSQSEFKRRVMRLLDAEPAHFRFNSSGLAMLLVLVVSTIAAPLAVRTWAQQKSLNSQSTGVPPGAANERLGRHIENFRLSDHQGKDYALTDFIDQPVVVVAFLGVDCPLSKLYAARLENLAAKYKSRGVAVIGIDANQQDTPTELAHFARQLRITYPLLKDPGNRVADQFRAERTPEAFVLDRDRTVRYWGRIDDQFGIGYARQEAAQHYVAQAVDDLLAGRPVTENHTASIGCHIGRVSRTEPRGDVTYARQISRIVERRCLECHREGGIAPFALASYDDVAAWAETIREVVEQERMPPWHANPQYGHFANDNRLPAAEKELLARWVDNGVPRGDDGDLPPPRQFVEGWALGRPDVLLTIPEPITIPPTGVVDYQYVAVDPGFTEGKWIRASEIRPGVRSVVHHIIVFIQPPGGDPILKERGVGFETVGGYVPGSPPMQLDDGVARYVPPGSTFVFQIHYTPDGTERQDQSQIGLYFADQAKVRRTMQTGAAANLDFEIPPHAAAYRVEAAHRFSHDMELYTLAPHMHYRGKSFRAEVTYPNGSREILLDVPHYDFNWQNNYKFAEPKFLPEGTLLRCIAEFDNSAGNRSNPDPTAAVRWGEQTWNEMMIGYFEGIFLNQDLSLPLPLITPVGDGSYRARFTYRPDRKARTVNLAGTFNDWSTSSHPMTDPDGDGVFVADVTLQPGAYRYKFVIDGNYWTHDPASRILTGFVHESFFVAGTPQDSSDK